jgi:hypothetical protein
MEERSCCGPLSEPDINSWNSMLLYILLREEGLNFDKYD